MRLRCIKCKLHSGIIGGQEVHTSWYNRWTTSVLTQSPHLVKNTEVQKRSDKVREELLMVGGKQTLTLKNASKQQKNSD
jgi:hypothetical protein